MKNKLIIYFSLILPILSKDNKPDGGQTSLNQLDEELNYKLKFSDKVHDLYEKKIEKLSDQISGKKSFHQKYITNYIIR